MALRGLYHNGLCGGVEAIGGGEGGIENKEGSIYNFVSVMRSSCSLAMTCWIWKYTVALSSLSVQYRYHLLTEWPEQRVAGVR